MWGFNVPALRSTPHSPQKDLSKWEAEQSHQKENMASDQQDSGLMLTLLTDANIAVSMLIFHVTERDSRNS